MRPTGTKVIATNRQARRNYAVLETIEAGLVLKGSEVKSLRESKVQIADAFARIDSGEVWLHALHIAPYGYAQDHTGHDPDRKRKLPRQGPEDLRQAPGHRRAGRRHGRPPRHGPRGTGRLAR
jgi:tmRNA-binding protein